MARREFPEIDGVLYTFQSVLGQGGAAEVFRVHSSVDGHAYALKRIAKYGRTSRDHQRFRNEIAFGLEASNDHVVRIHAQHEDSDYFYYTMDLYSKSLRDTIADEFDYETLLDYLSQLCDGLAYVHRKGVAHRDIKPENILVDSEDQRLVLADFGIAHFKDSSLTERRDLLANRNYQAPEQMVKKDAGNVGRPADIFALGLIMTELFTKENARGLRHMRVGDVYPFLSDLDLLVERMMLQDPAQRIGIEAARDLIHLARLQVESKAEEIREDLQRAEVADRKNAPDADLILERASKDVLSAKYIFERTTDDELSRYNLNYHCEIGYSASSELFNACVQSQIYLMCKAKFEYEGNGDWDDTDLEMVTTTDKEGLLRELESIQSEYPLSRNSIWSELPRRAAHYFRFCKDYHCEELLQSIVEKVSDTGAGSLQNDLLDAPILWIARSVRGYLATDLFETSPQNLEQIKFERQVSIHWQGTSLEDLSRTATGIELFDKSQYAESVAHILEELEDRWDVSVGERVDGTFSIHFRSREEFLRFRKEALAIAAPYYAFEGDVQDLLTTEAAYDDLVALIWEPIYDIRITLAKVLGLREISAPKLPAPPS